MPKVIEEGTHEPEPQEKRGLPGSRDKGRDARPARQIKPSDYSGVNPLGPIDPRMPMVKPGDQGG